jgi:hypothetical protein
MSSPGSTRAQGVQKGPFPGRGTVASATFKSVPFGTVGSWRDPVRGHRDGRIHSSSATPLAKEPMTRAGLRADGSPRVPAGAVVEYRTLIPNTSPSAATIHAERRFSARASTAQMAGARGVVLERVGIGDRG